MIYLDNSATTLIKPPQVAEAVYNSINSLGNCGRGAYSSTLNAGNVIYEARELIAELFSLDYPEQVAFTLNATEALNTAIYGLLGGCKHIVTTELEHNSVLRPLYRLENDGTELSIIKADKQGCIDYKELEKAIKPDTRAVVCTHASNLTGNAVNIELIGKICKEHNILFILDASQSAGILPINMNKSNIDVLCFTGHKGLYGPQGTGGLCVKKGLDITPLKVGGSGIKTFLKSAPPNMPEHLEAGTVNSHGIAGLRAGVEFILNTGVNSIHKREIKLWQKLYTGIKDISGITLYGDLSTTYRAPILSFNIGDYSSGVVSDELFMRFHIATRSGGHCAPLMHKAFGTEKQGAVRLSLSYFNTEEEIAKTIEAIKTLVEE